MSDESHPISSSPYRQLAAAEQAHANAVQVTVSGIADETALHQWASCKAAAIRTSGSANADELRFILDVVDRAAVLRLSPDAAAALSWRCRTAAQNALAVPGAEDVRMLRACLAALDSISDTAPPSTSAPPAGTRQSEGEKPPADTDAKPDGPFDADGFRFAGAEVRFGRAGKQYRLVMALWDATKNAPAAPRPVEDVIAEVWGDDNDTEDTAFRKLCSDVRGRFQSVNCPLDVVHVNGMVQLKAL